MELGTSQISYNRLGRGLPPNQHWKYCVPSTNGYQCLFRQDKKCNQKVHEMESHRNLSPLASASHRSWKTFWSEEGGPGEVLALAWPLMLSTGLFSLTLFVDRMMLYWYSNEAASAAMAAGTVFWVVTCVPLGTIGYTSTFVSQYFGVHREDRALHVVAQGLLLSLANRSAIDLDHAQYRLSLPRLWARGGIDRHGGRVLSMAGRKWLCHGRFRCHDRIVRWHGKDAHPAFFRCDRNISQCGARCPVDLRLHDLSQDGCGWSSPCQHDLHVCQMPDSGLLDLSVLEAIGCLEES